MLEENPLEALQARYARALDSKDLAGWAACFAREAGYSCITRENVSQGLPIALILDDSRGRIDDRVKIVSEVWAGTFEDYSTRHFVQNIHREKSAPDAWAAQSNFIVAYTTADGDSQVLAAGVYEDEMVLESGRLVFRSRKAVLDTTYPPRYLVYPI